MKKLLVLLTIVVFMITVDTRIFADVSVKKDDKVVTDMSITFGYSVGLLTPLDRQQTDNTLEVTVAPFSRDGTRQGHYDRIDIYAELYD